MIDQDQFSKRGYIPLTRLPRGPLDVVVFASRSHLIVCVTAVVDGRREIVGVEVQPIPGGFDVRTWPAQGQKALRPRLVDVLDRYTEYPPGSFRPVSADLLRGIPMTTVLAYRAHDVASRQHIGGVLAAEGISAAIGRDEISAEDELRLSYLNDALMYVAALAERIKPAELIAEERSISKRTAEGRIAKARELGLLTQAQGRTASGELTADAIRLADWRDRMTERQEENRDG